MTNAVIYARYSSHNQQEQSIEGQLRACRDYANSKGLNIIHEYCDRARSGTNDKRPEFQKMLHDALKGEFSVVLVYQFDRFARNRRESMNNKFYLKANGVSVVSINERIDESDSTSVLIEGMFESIAEFYSKDLSLKVKRGMKESVIKRKTIGGHRLYGYTTDQDKNIIIVPDEAETVRMIYKMRIRKTTLTDIADYLELNGIKYHGDKFTKSTLRRIMMNPKYTGRFINPFNPVEVIKDMYPKIISINDYESVQKTFENYKNNSCKSINNPNTFYLSGKLFSGLDGAVYSGTSAYGKNKKRYTYYQAVVCGKKIKYKQYELEDAIIKAAKNVIEIDETLDYLADLILEDVKKKAENPDKSDLIRLKNQLQDEIDRISAAFVDANDAMRRALNKKIIECEERILEIDRKIDSAPAGKAAKMANKNLIKLFLRDLLSKDLTVDENRKEFFTIFVNSVFVSDNHIDIYLNYDVEDKITFSEYKNDLSELQRVRLRFHLAEQERLELSHQLPDLRP